MSVLSPSVRKVSAARLAKTQRNGRLFELSSRANLRMPFDGVGDACEP